MSNAPQPDTQPASRSPDLVRHMVGCQPCDGHLGALKSTPDVLDHLVNAGRAEDTSSRVEGVLAVAGRQGDLELQRLLYELGRSSLALIPEFREGKILEDLKPVEVVSHQLDAMIPRAEGQCSTEMTEAAKTFRAEQITRPQRPAELALSLGEVLAKMQEVPEQGAFLVGEATYQLGDFDTARLSFASVYSASTSPRLRTAAASGVMHVLLKAGRPAEAIVFANASAPLLHEDPSFWLNRATAYAWLEEARDARSSLESFAEASKRGEALRLPDDWWAGEERFFAQKIGCSIDEIRTLLRSR